MSLNPGQVLDEKYQILRLLGTGGMGAVYEGENLRIKRRVAIKVLHASVSSAADNVARFEREAQAAGRIGSEHICEVLDLGVLPDGSRYMVMEYLDGETLSQRIKKNGRLAPAQSIPLMAQVLDALGAAHTAGIVHRDLKPDNIFILPNKAGRADFIKILDFGVSKFSQISGEEMNVTRAGAVVGTPYYMSPEQARGMAQVDARSDIYALGVVLYQATTGQVPFRAETFNELLFKIALELPPPPQQFVPDLDPEFAAIIQKAMAREQPHRFQSCAEFKDALLAWQAARATPGYGFATGPGMHVTGPGHITMPPGMLQGPLVHTPPPGMISGVGPGPVIPGQTDGSQATANAWGNASGAAQPAPAPTSSRSGALVGVLVTAVMLGGLGVAGYFVFGQKDSNANSSPAVSATNTSATNAPQANPPESATPPVSAAPPPEATPSADASAREVALDEPPTADISPDAGPATAAAPTASTPFPFAASSTTKTFSGPKPGGSSTNKTKKPGGVDLGY
ncbi:MAG: protein kinase [Polyangiaceae bacterium]|nr:protein kinase [Polyangiaceae bacterium]